MKTTNAKSKAFQTPAPLGSSAKTQKISPRLRRPKVKVHQPEPDAESEDDVPEVEYMPPKEVPLADDMDEYLPKDWNFPKIDSKTMARGILSAYRNPIEDDGRPKKLREFEEELEREKKQRDIDFDTLFSAQMAKDDAEIRKQMGVPEPSKPPKRATTNISTMKARSAAQALSPVRKPSFAAPTAATKSRLPTGLVASKKPTKAPVEPTASRRAVAAAASHSTIGYAQGRSAPAARKPLSNVTKPAPFSTTTTTSRRPAPSSTVRSRTPFSRSSSAATLVAADEPVQSAAQMEHEFDLEMLSREDEGGDDAWMASFNTQLRSDIVDEELEEFQLRLPEGF
jgi:hypothetical protein